MKFLLSRNGCLPIGKESVVNNNSDVVTPLRSTIEHSHNTREQGTHNFERPSSSETQRQQQRDDCDSMESPRSSSSKNKGLTRRKSLLKSPLSLRFSSSGKKEAASSLKSSHEEKIPLSPNRLVFEENCMPKSSRPCNNVLDWIEDHAPMDIVPLIFSFLGPRKLLTLSRTSKSWRSICCSEIVWRVLSEDMGKWHYGENKPSSWLEYYRQNPCVPIDYNTIQSALDAAAAECKQNRHFKTASTTLRIFLRPGKYIQKNSLLIDRRVLGISQVVIETAEVPSSYACHDAAAATQHAPISSSTQTTARRRSSMDNLRQMLTCRSSSALEQQPSRHRNAITAISTSTQHETSTAGITSKKAVIFFKTRNQNEPIIRLQNGKLHLKKMSLIHYCNGTDIWNGNAAVQIQPPTEEHHSARHSVPQATLTQVDITSISGRGVVNIDGGNVTMNHCYIHNCAATGIYIGGPGSHASISSTDILHNGNGNPLNRRGISRGHSGLYLEQGTCILQDCNISSNALTGISAVSSNNATISVTDSDLMRNGTMQLELPPLGSASRNRSVEENNALSQYGIARSRSGIIPDSNTFENSSLTSRNSPQSPNNNNNDPSRVLIDGNSPRTTNNLLQILNLVQH